MISLNLFIAVIPLLITGLDVSATAQVAYARAFDMTPLQGLQKYLRGAAWIVLLLADTVVVLALRNLAASRPAWFTVAAGALLLVLEFTFYLVTPGCCWSCRSNGETFARGHMDNRARPPQVISRHRHRPGRRRWDTGPAGQDEVGPSSG